jgi:transposase
MLFVGIDWAEASHAVCVLAEDGRVLATQQIADSAAGVSALQQLLARHATEPSHVAIGIETDRGMVVRALRAAGYQLYAINPLAANRYRDRHTTSRSKSDPGDAKMLADLVRTDRHNHRVLEPDSDEVEALQVLTRTHQRLIWERGRHTNQLRSLLREFYPGALAAVGDALETPVACALLRRAPTPERGRRLTVRQLMGILRRAGRKRGIEREAQTIQAALRAAQLEQPAVLATAYGTAVQAQVQLLTALTSQIDALEQALSEQFEVHPDAELIRSLPGLGTVLGARVLAEFGDAPTRYADSKARKSYAGTAPITRTSGLKHTVLRRFAGNRQLAATCSWWAFCSLTTSEGAARYYRALRARGKTHQQALRALANRWVGILHGCLRHRTPYDEATAWPPLAVLDATEPAEHLDNPSKSTDDPPGSPGSVPASA